MSAGLPCSFLTASRFCSLGLVLDLQSDDLAVALAAIQSHDALSALEIAKAVQARYVVLAGQLRRKKAGALTLIVRDDDVDAVIRSARLGFERLTELGETYSLWAVLIAEPARSRVSAALAGMSATAGTA